MRPKTITVDITHGGDYALVDYERQSYLNYAARQPSREFANIKREVRAWWREQEASDET